VIVSMKPTATVAKVVNPLGTVVTVQSDDETAEEVVEDAVIHENCDEALFRPVVAPKAVFYSESKPKPCPPENMLTKSLEANTEVAVKIINKKDDNKIKEKNNRLSSKHITRSREGSPKVAKTRDNKTAITRAHLDTANQNRPETKAKKDNNKKREEKVQDCSLEKSALDVLDSFVGDLPPVEFKIEEPIKEECPLFESILKFEDAEDCSEKVTNALNKSDSKTESEITCSSEEEKLMTRKTRKPKAKLGVKITKEKENASLIESETLLNPPKKSWNVVAATKPKIMDMEDSVETVTVKLPKNLIDVDVESVNTKNESREDFNLLKMDKSSDENGSSPADTTESDDSSKIPPIVDVEDDNVAPTQIMQSSSKASRRKSKKKRK
jgi:hypothetical protein